MIRVDGDCPIEKFDGLLRLLEVSKDDGEIGEHIDVAGRDRQRTLIPGACLVPPTGIKVDVAHGGHQLGVFGVGGQETLDLADLLAQLLSCRGSLALDRWMPLGESVGLARCRLMPSLTAFAGGTGWRSANT